MSAHELLTEIIRYGTVGPDGATVQHEDRELYVIARQADGTYMRVAQLVDEVAPEAIARLLSRLNAGDDLARREELDEQHPRVGSVVPTERLLDDLRALAEGTEGPATVALLSAMDVVERLAHPHRPTPMPVHGPTLAEQHRAQRPLKPQDRP